MKVAIQGHSTRGKEIIQILESLGGKNKWFHEGTNPDCYYELHDDYIWCTNTRSEKFKYYTLEEFEKEFPFKIGDLCVYYSDILDKEIVVKILGMAIENDCIMYEVGYKDITKAHSGIYRERHTLKPYKEMKEERNITLTLEKAKEWYKKGGELKEVALQAYSEEELTKIELPKTWEEFCANYPIQAGEAIIDEQTSQIRRYNGIVARCLTRDKNVYTSQKSAEAHLAMIQLEQLRNCYRQGWVPSKGNSGFGIRLDFYEGFRIVRLYSSSAFLSFPTEEIAKEFLECFKDLIEKAGDLI